MKWTTKAKLQKAIATLPLPLARTCYRSIQWLYHLYCPRSPKEHIESVLTLADAIQMYGCLQGATIVEIGTGQRMNLPIIFWLLGADRITSVDLHRNIMPVRVRSHINWYRSHRAWLAEVLPVRAGHRLDELLALNAKSPKKLVKQIMDLCNISYLAPADACDLDLPDQQFDLHCSNNCLEHFPPKSLHRMLETAKRLLKPGGLCVHQIDLADHFASSDPTISTVNFLKFDKETYGRYSSALMYLNRLRVSDYRRIFEHCGFDILAVDTSVDICALNLIDRGALEVAEQFRGMEATDLATKTAIFVASHRHDDQRS